MHIPVPIVYKRLHQKHYIVESLHHDESPPKTPSLLLRFSRLDYLRRTDSTTTATFYYFSSSNLK